LARSDDARNLLNQMSANLAAAFGAAGFFFARPLVPWLQPGGTPAAISFYDTKHLKQTLERLVDFDRLNAGMTRFSAGAVNVRTGNSVYFDTTTHKITLALVDAVFVKHLEERVIVAIVDTHTDDHRSLSIERLRHDWGDVVGLVDH
jgi:predicted acylesterase/phospholipase RssA